MADFPNYDPVYSAVKNSAPNARLVRFGDGYEHRLRFGLNQNPKEWNLTFDVSDSDANIIEAFLDARADDSASFDWTPPDSTTPYKWICPEWSKSIPYNNRATINARFVQVFEP